MNIPQNLNQSIIFQPGSIVSKEIIDKPAGSITFFAFDKDQGLSEHTAPYDALVLVTEGNAEVTLSGVANTVKSGESILMPANSPHSLKAQEPFKMLLIMIKS